MFFHKHRRSPVSSVSSPAMLRRLRTQRQQSTDTLQTLTTSGPVSPSGAPPPPSSAQPPQVQEPYFTLPSHHFTLHSHLRFNPAPQGPPCNCGTWQMWCLPPHLGGCGHVYVQMILFCGKTVDDEEPEKAMASACPGVVIRRLIRCAGYMMGLCPTCRSDPGVVQTYNNFVAPFFVPKGLTGMKLSDAEDRSGATWKAHSLAFAAWISTLREQRLIG